MRYLFFILAVAGALAFCEATTYAQTVDEPSLFPRRDRRNHEEEEKIREMLAKQEALRNKKDHEEMLKRGEDAVRLSNELERAFERSDTLTPDERKKLEALEKLATKIRNELGGDDDGDVEAPLINAPEKRQMSLKEAFGRLRSTTLDLVDELKKTSRFSISVVAIQSSNAVIRIARFLRLRN